MNRQAPVVRVVLAAGLLALACGRDRLAAPESAAEIRVTSPAFAAGTAIPDRHTCAGEDVSPALSWSGVPPAARGLVLICDDPDAPLGTWVHWVAYDIPATATGIAEGVAPEGSLPQGGHQGNNSWKRLGYGGPCPPSGTHHYVFKLFAVDTDIALAPGATKAEVGDAIAGHIIAYGELTGTYAKK